VALRPAGTLVTGLHVGYMDTDMTAGLDVAKADPRDVARQAVDALREDRTEVLADDVTRTVKRALAGDLAPLYPAA
jgi:NAD(P)-dependent dehydrogenase (short-subunit alcohol dehydrogenase family)